MPLIDERGRVLGKVNLIDLLVGVVVLLLVGLGITGIITARKAPAPVLGEVTPKELVAGPDLRIQLTGDHFLPYLRVFLQRSDQAVEFVRPTRPGEPSDEYTLANAAVATFLVESPRLAEIRLPADLPPGKSDMALYNETEQVALKRDAFSVLAPAAAAPPPSSPRVTVRVVGSFHGLRPERVGALRSGLRLPTPEGGPWAEILSVDSPRPDVARVKSGTSYVLAPIAELRQLPATLRVNCEFVNGECRMSGTVLQPDARIALPTADGPVTFVVEHLRSELEVIREARLYVRFMLRPEFAQLVHVGDTSQPLAASGAARLLEIRDKREVPSQVAMTLSDLNFQQFSAQDRVVLLDATVSVPVLSTGYGWSYRGEPVRAGAALNFETPTYLMRGWILSVTFPERARPATH